MVTPLSLRMRTERPWRPDRRRENPHRRHQMNFKQGMSGGSP
ncbi:hypothetical protein HMPREF0682_2189 [Propionibacterium acidifaciens F0233]|uniref:Uncharacterized protein n=1 Tax=Propionibacterium acidifaciens F0233 TaxID=553198 RepID=U2QTP1_9ACTN|nr:hypothetical protein HMPREF0682_2189 [Propionibacterium acidifaciens F0233]